MRKVDIFALVFGAAVVAFIWSLVFLDNPTRQVARCDADGVIIRYSKAEWRGFVSQGVTPYTVISCPEVPSDGFVDVVGPGEAFSRRWVGDDG